MFIKGEAMDIGVLVTDVEAAILSRLVEVYFGLRMCTSTAISEQILLHCSLTFAQGHHALQRWIVEKAIAAMHDTLQDDVTDILYMTTFIAPLLDGLDRQRHHINEYAILLAAKACHILDIFTFAKCFTMCSLWATHSAKARSLLTCAACNSPWCDAMKCRHCPMPEAIRNGAAHPGFALKYPKNEVCTLRRPENKVYTPEGHNP